MLLSIINMKLRDNYPTLDELCTSEGIDRQDLIDRLAEAGFIYMAAVNQFR